MGYQGARRVSRHSKGREDGAVATRIFLSHSHRDVAIAKALKAFLDDLFGEHVDVQFSSDQTAGGGIPPGAEWLPWVTGRIKEADKTYVLLTPNSMHMPWVLWESGAAAGVALAAEKSSPVVPITFGLSDNDIPSPFVSRQCVRGDTIEAGGINRLVQGLNRDHTPQAAKALQLRLNSHRRDFLTKVKKALRDAARIAPVLRSVHEEFPAKRLDGFWVTCYDFKSGGRTLYHADIAELKAESDQHMRARNHRPKPHTEKHDRPFLNEIEVDLAHRQLIGHWKNTSDMRYFGAIHLAVQTGENVMEGYYTCLASDVTVGSGHWKWVRIDPRTLARINLSQMVLRAPREVKKRLASHRKDAGPLRLRDVVEKT